MKEYLLGIDLGTSGTKTVLFRSDGTAMAAHTVEYLSLIHISEPTRRS